jgi:hypothetical protein
MAEKSQPLLQFLLFVSLNPTWFTMDLPTGDEMHAPFQKHSMSEDEVFSLLKFQTVSKDDPWVEVPSRAERRKAAAKIIEDTPHWEMRGSQFWPTYDYLSCNGEDALMKKHHSSDGQLTSSASSCGWKTSGTNSLRVN